MQYCPYENLREQPNAIISGTATHSTLLEICPFNAKTLSAISDTSTGIVHDQAIREQLANCVVTSSDRFSIDALTAIFTITNQTDTIAPDILQEIARTSLYDRGLDREIIHIVFILNSWLDVHRSPLKPNIFQQGHLALATVLFEELLPRLSKIIEKVDYLERYWIDEEMKLKTTEVLLDSKSTELTEVPGLDLAIFTIASAEIEEEGKLFHLEQDWFNALHPIGIHNRTTCNRILLQAGRKSFFYLRSELAAHASNKSGLKGTDMAALASELNKNENALCWVIDKLRTDRPALIWTGELPHNATAKDVQRTIAAFLQNQVAI